jgi:NADH:ubiquinone oxidoreductase subunit C
MNNEELKQKISAIESDLVFEDKQYLTITVEPEKFKGLALKLRNDKDLSFDYMFNITGVDYGDLLGVCYFITSTQFSHIIELKVKAKSRENAEIETVCDIWKTAEFQEREIYDLLGIKFINHPDLRRIFLEEDWVGYPLRKDYVDEVNIVER